MVKPAELLRGLRSFKLERSLFETDAAADEEDLVLQDLRIPRITNEFWTARQRQGHSLHELSYRACFKAELPRFFIDRLTRPGEVVFDPFMGRGTTLLEAALTGRVPAGNDVNPLGRILLEPRLRPPELSEVATRIDEIFAARRSAGPSEDEPDLGVFYEPRTLHEIRMLRQWFLRREREQCLDATDRWLRMVATNRLTGHSPGFFSGRTMPPNQAVTVETQRRLNARLGIEPPRRDVRRILLRKSRSLLRGLTPRHREALADAAEVCRITTGDARRLSGHPTGSVACTVTSPPFLNVVDYAKDNWLRCWFNGLDAGEIAARVTTNARLEVWCGFLDGVFHELYRVTRPGGWVVFEVGEVRGGELKLEEPVLPLARAAGFRPIGVAVHMQEFTKTANCWGVTNNRKGTNTNRLVLLHKDP